MAQKTLIKELLSKYAPLSIELQKAILADNEDSNVNEVKRAKDITPQEPENLSDLLSAPEETEQAKDATPLEDDAQNSAADNVTDFVDPETGQMDMLEGEDF